MMIRTTKAPSTWPLVELRYGKDEAPDGWPRKIIVTQQQEIDVMHLGPRRRSLARQPRAYGRSPRPLTPTGPLR